MSDSFFLVAEEAFRFLEKHGFLLVEKGRVTIVYESSVCAVSLFYDDQRSFEISLGLSRKSAPHQPSYTFDEILRSQGVSPTDWPSGYSVENLAEVRSLIARMASIMSLYANQLLDGENNAWTRIDEQRRTDCIACAAATNLTHAKRAADTAWAGRDYRKVVEALDGVQASLGKADVSKLVYAKRAIGF